MSDDELKKGIDKAMQPSGTAYGTFTNVSKQTYTWENIKATIEEMKKSQAKFAEECAKFSMDAVTTHILSSFNLPFHVLYGASRYEMDEQEWMTSTDAVRMYNYIKPYMTNIHRAYFENACIDLFPDFMKMNWPGQIEAAHILRDIFGNPFWPNSAVIDPTIFEWQNGTIRGVARKIAGVCAECKGRGWHDWSNKRDWARRCESCKGTGYSSKPEWRDLPDLADALEYAGYTDKRILDHFRGTELCLWCLGLKSRIRVYGQGEHGQNEQESCDHCDGTGYKKTLHVRGCWALELFLGGFNA
jgi:hypothetical protein